MANPTGNPETLKSFKAKGREPLIATVAVKIYPSKCQKLKAIPNWTDKLRDAIDKLIQEHETGGGQGDG